MPRFDPKNAAPNPLAAVHRDGDRLDVDNAWKPSGPTVAPADGSEGGDPVLVGEDAPAAGRAEPEPDVIVTSDRASFGRYLLASPDERGSIAEVQVTGNRTEVSRFQRMLEGFPPPAG